MQRELLEDKAWQHLRTAPNTHRIDVVYRHEKLDPSTLIVNKVDARSWVDIVIYNEKQGKTSQDSSNDRERRGLGQVHDSPAHRAAAVGAVEMVARPREGSDEVAAEVATAVEPRRKKAKKSAADAAREAELARLMANIVTSQMSTPLSVAYRGLQNSFTLIMKLCVEPGDLGERAWAIAQGLPHGRGYAAFLQKFAREAWFPVELFPDDLCLLLGDFIPSKLQEQFYCENDS